MKIDQTKCDHCGKVHEAPNRFFSKHDRTKLLAVPLKGKGGTQYLDFCDEDCLRNELLRRKAGQIK